MNGSGSKNRTYTASMSVCRPRDCGDIDCGLHGRCVDGFCACDVGFYGERCHLSSGCPGVLQQDGSCCYSGLISTRDAEDNLSFECCAPGNSLDARGACCDGMVDGFVPLSRMLFDVTALCSTYAKSAQMGP